MLKIYKLMNKEEHIGYILRDTSLLKCHAMRFENIKQYPLGLFGFSNRLEVPHQDVIDYLDSIVPPADRDNIREILDLLEIPQYDKWTIYEKMKGKNAKDYSHLIFEEETDETIEEAVKRLQRSTL